MKGKTGRMAVGVAQKVGQVLDPTAGWVGTGCDNKVWYYSSTGGVRAGSKVLHETGVRFSEGDTILVGLDMDRGDLHFVRAGATALPVVQVKKEEELFLVVLMFFRGASCELREVPLNSPAPLSHLVNAAAVQIFSEFYPGGGAPPSVPRLSLQSVSEPVRKKECFSSLTRGPSATPFDDAKSQDPPGPLSARALQGIQPLVSMGATPLGAGGQTTPRGRPSPRVSSVMRPQTPRTALSDNSSEVTPRGNTPRNAQPSPRTHMGGLPSPPSQPSPFVSPRYVSPRTPRGMLLTSPRRCNLTLLLFPEVPLHLFPVSRFLSNRKCDLSPSPNFVTFPSFFRTVVQEAVQATMSLKEHRDLDVALRRIAQLEEQMHAAAKENQGLQEELARARALATLSETHSE